MHMSGCYACDHTTTLCSMLGKPESAKSATSKIVWGCIVYPFICSIVYLVASHLSAISIDRTCIV